VCWVVDSLCAFKEIEPTKHRIEASSIFFIIIAFPFDYNWRY
jgi:hypothetical protein